MTTPTRIVLLPRWGGDSSSDFYPWLQRSLGDHPMVVVRIIPEPGAPDVEAWPQRALEALGTGPEALSRTVLVGHSVGAQAAMRAASMLPDGTTLRGLLLVAGWWSVDEPWPSLMPWLEPFDWAKARGAAGRVVTLLSDDDPYTRDHAAQAGLFRERLGAEVRVAPGRKHFNEAEQPAVLSALREML